MLNRRHFLTGLAAAAPLTLKLTPAQAHPFPWLSPHHPPHTPPCGNTATVWQNAFRDLRPSYDTSLPMRVPQGLRGTLYRNGPGLMTLGGTPYRHWLDGDGMVHAFQFTEGRLRHHAKLVSTRKLQAELAAGRRLSPGFGTSIPGTSFSGPDDLNVVNINTLMLGNGELLAMGEGAAPYVLDPESLQTQGQKVWSEPTRMLPFSAHPRTDAQGNIWMFGYIPGQGLLSVCQLDARGTLVRQAFVPAPNTDMVHDFAITEKYLVFVLMPYRYVPDTANPSLSFIDHYVWQAGQPGLVLVVDKASLGVVQQIECPPTALFHLGNAWEVGNTLRFGVVGYTSFPEFMRKAGSVFDNAAMPYPETRWMEFEVDLSRRSVRIDTPLDGTVEFPRFDARRTGVESRFVYLMTSRRPANDPLFGFDTVQSLDQRSGRCQSFNYGPGFVAEEHVFVPQPGREHERRGWLIGTAFDWVRERSVVSIFDAAHIDHGPTAQLTLPYALPLGIHGQFHAQA